MRLLRRIVAVTVLLAATLVAALLSYRPGLDAYRAHALPESPIAPGALTATWFGVTAVLLDDGEHAVFVDPFFTRPEGLLRMARNASIAPDEARIRGWMERADVKHLDAVLVSHSHFDHAMDAGVVARIAGAQLVGSPSTANIGLGAGLPASQIVTVRPGEPMTFGSFRVTFVESRHAGATGGKPTGDIAAPLVPPAHYLDYKLGGTYSILIEHPQGRVLHHGSAGFVPDALRGAHADVAFLGVALIDDLEAYLRQTVDLVGARRVIPVHWDDFTRPLDRPLVPFPVVVRLDRFFAQMPKLRPDVRVETLEVGGRRALFAEDR